MRFSIRYQLLLPLVMLILGVVGISAWTAWSAAARARWQIEEHMEAIVKTVQSATFPRNVQSLRLMKNLSGAEFLLCDAQRRPIGPRDEPAATLAALADAPLPPADDAQAGLGVPVKVADADYFCRAAPLSGGGLLLFVFYPESLYRDAVWQAIRPSLVLGVVGGVVSVVLTIAVTQRMTRRIQGLERRTRLIAQGDFSPIPLPARDDELRDLAQSVNDMAQQLARFQETMRTTERLRLLGQVSGGLAHQLRNGAAGARLAVQLHARECDHDAESLEVALRQLSLMEMHLKRFLGLGQSEVKRAAPCDVIAIVRETMTLLGPSSRHAHIDLRWRGGQPPAQPCPVFGDAEQLGHLVLNILTNAMEAAGPGGWVDVAVTAEATLTGNGHAAAPPRVLVEVRDSGPGPDPHVAARLFEPFVTAKPEGVGLGLAVARQVAQAHGGDITWTRDDGVTCFRFTLPSAPPTFEGPRT